MSAPYYEQGGIQIIHGDSRDMDLSGVDAVICDPPYELNFMGKAWDRSGVSFDPATWEVIFDSMKPGAHLLACGGPRTFHRMVVAIEDAGFEIRDCISYLYGTGFPKSANVSKMIDKQERDKWLNVCNRLDNLSQSEIIESWKTHSDTAKHAGISFRKNQTDVGDHTPKNGSVHALVLLSASPKNSDACAVIAELSLTEAHPTSEACWSFAPLPAENGTTVSSDPVTIAGRLPASQEATPSMGDSSVPCAAWDSLDVKETQTTRVEEALMTWIGSGKSSKPVATTALCAELTDDLKRTMLNQSRTFQNFDTIAQTACVSATTATITESTAALLISSMVDTLKNKALDKAAGATREVVSSKMTRIPGGNTFAQDTWTQDHRVMRDVDITAPATDLARQWDGWGTALKPAWEPVIVARKPFKGTVAANVTEQGTGALNIDGCRIGTGGGVNRPLVKSDRRMDANQTYGDGLGGSYHAGTTTLGRWPANVCLDEDAAAALDAQSGERKAGGKVLGTESSRTGQNGIYGIFGRVENSTFNDTGGASRFFYTAKASRRERGEGNDHPTVKPLALMRWLVRLVTPPGGLIYDPFMGSGTTLLAAQLEGFRAIGVDLSEHNCEIAVSRLRQSVMPLEIPA